MNKSRLFYLLTISLLSTYTFHLHQKKNRQMEQYYLHTKTQNQVLKYIDRCGLRLETDIAKNTSAYRDSTQISIKIDADRLEPLNNPLVNFINTEYAQKKKYNIRWSNDNDYSPNLEHVLTKKAIDSFFLSQHNILDSLKLIARNDEHTNQEIEVFFSENRLNAANNILSGFRSDQKFYLFELSLFNQYLANYRIMSHLKSLTKEIIPRVRIRMPLISLKKSCYKTGEIISGELFSTIYYENVRNLKAYVNGKQLPMENGLFKYKKTFKSAGNYQFKIQLRVQNPLTEVFKNFDQNYTIQVCD
jgi:hypothetical protein